MDIKSNTKVQKLNWTDKEKLCKLWQNSSEINRSIFCKQKNLSDSTFYRWCKRFGITKHHKNKKINWFPVNLKQQNDKQNKLPETVLIKLLLPNNIVAKMNIGTNTIVNLIKELSDANTVIR